LGNGDGTFQAPVAYAVGPLAEYLATGDFNGDGKMDVATQFTSGSEVSVLLGNGDGTLQPPVVYSAGATLITVPFVIADFNADGRSDLAFGRQGSNDLRVLLGAPPTRAITLDTVPSGLSITVDNVNYTAPQTFQWIVGSSHTIATSTPQAGAAGTRYVFSTWSDGGAQSHTITVPISQAMFTANFTTQYQLNLSGVPSAAGTVLPASGAFYNSGQVVAVSATPAAGYGFASWTGPVASPTSASTSVTMNGPVNLTANFTGSVQLVTTVSVQISSNRVVYTVNLLIRNTGTADATVILPSAQLNSITEPAPSPQFHALPAGGSVNIPIVFPLGAGAPGSPAVVRYSGTYSGGSGGTFSGSVRVTLPN
jgi:hypothetical protein